MVRDAQKFSLVPAPQVERILGLLREHHAEGRQDTIPWRRLAELTGLPHPSTKLYSVTKRATKRFWKETDKLFVTDRGIGVRISSGDEQLSEARGKTMHAVREMRFAHDVGATIADDRLDEMGRKRRDHFVIRMQQLKAVAQRESRMLTAEFKAYESLPRPLDVAATNAG